MSARRLEARRRTRRLGFAVKVLGRNLKSHDTRRWQSGPSLATSIDSFDRILDYLDEVDIRMYRLSSSFVPYGTHPDLPQFHGQLEKNRARLRDVGERAARLDIRLSLHPSQYVVLNAPDASIAAKAAWDLDVQSRLLDGLEAGPEAVVVLHLGGAYEDKRVSRERFARNAKKLSGPARRRLVIENDEISFTVEDCLWVNERLGTPVVFDHQHHRLNPGNLSAEEAVRLALRTWDPHVVPKIHFSSPRLDGREIGRGVKKRYEPPLLRQHADFVDPWTFAALLDAVADLDFDVMLEAKAKDLAVLRLREQLKTLRLDRSLRRPEGKPV